MEALESRLRRTIEPLGYRVDVSPNGFALKSCNGYFVVEGAYGLSIEELEPRVDDIAVGRKRVTLVPLYSATAKAVSRFRAMSSATF